jgi:hypothetical protein
MAFDEWLLTFKLLFREFASEFTDDLLHAIGQSHTREVGHSRARARSSQQSTNAAWE